MDRAIQEMTSAANHSRTHLHIICKISTGAGMNDPNSPVFDNVHGVFHHFYQIHLAAEPGHGPDYGHFVSKDFVHWAALPVAIWNGLDSSVWPPRVTKYDNEAIFTGSAVLVDGAAPDGNSKRHRQHLPWFVQQE